MKEVIRQKIIINKVIKYLFTPIFKFNRVQFNLIGIFFIFIGTVIGGIGIIPKIFALNDTKKEWTYSIATASDYTYDSNLMTVDNTGAHPNNTANKFTNSEFTSNNSSWTVGSVLPTGWVEVPGNVTYGTSNFLVMKYEAKCATNAAPTVGLTSPANGTVETYMDNGASNTPNNCTSANTRQVVSLPGGYPIGDISQTDAIARCASISMNGTPMHLINNNEWMTVARNAESVSTNWSGGSVGSGYLYAGHNDNSPGKARIASSNDSYRAAYTDAPGTTEALTVASNTANGQSGTVGNQVRNFNLSNGSIVWDIAGNMVEWTSDTILGKDEPTGATPGFNWRQFTALTTYGSLTYDKVRPLSSSYDSSYGVGQIYTDGSISNNTSYSFLRGGSWEQNSSLHTGAYSIQWNLLSSQTWYAIGFRCASDPISISQSFSSSSGVAGGGGNTVSVGNITDGKITQNINVGDTYTYDISAYVYDNTSGNVGGTVSSSIASLWYNGSVLSTTYSNATSTKGAGWWKLSGTLTGANASREYGITVKTGKTVKLDDFTLSKSGVYSVFTTSAYLNNQVTSYDSFCEGTFPAFSCIPDSSYSSSSSIKYQLCEDDGTVCEAGSSWKYWNGSSWTTALNTTTNVNLASELTQSVMQAFSITSKKISVKAIFNFEGEYTTPNFPKLPHINIGVTTDVTPPTTNASSISMTRAIAGTSVSSNTFTNGSSPYFSWTAGTDNGGGTGIRGYCLYLGLDDNQDGNPDGNPATSKGLLGTSPSSLIGSTCQFIVTSTNVDFSNASYRGAPWMVSSNKPYILAIKAIDNSGNIFTGSDAKFQFKFDNTPPNNVSYLSCASGNFSNVIDMNFSWPISGGVASSDGNSDLLGWQYQINGTGGTWLGTTTESIVGVNNYIPTPSSVRVLSQAQDSSSIVSGNNIIYFRTVDIAGNPSTDNTIRTCNLSYGGAAPAFTGIDSVSVTPSISTSNSYSLSYPAATPTIGQSVSHYYYMVNTLPPSTLLTLQSNSSTYFDNGTSLSVPLRSLPNVNKGANTVYVVGIDNALTPNYSPSNYISGTFTLNSTDPDNVSNLVASDSSIKLLSKWNVTLTYASPTYEGAGNLTYLIFRSSDGITFSQVGSTSGLSYVDSTPLSSKYFYKVYTKDGALSLSSGTNGVSITPTGKWTTSALLISSPINSNISTKRATISWTTDRSSDSKVQFGIKSGVYMNVEPSIASQVTSHSIELTGLNPDTTYFYKAKWTDEDGNTGESEEKTFTTDSAPTIKNVLVKYTTLSSANIQFVSKGSSKVKIYYGTTSNFGGVKEINTSSSESTYTVILEGLEDGTKYYYRINPYDIEDTEYEGTVLDLKTYHKPKIYSVALQQIRNSAQTSIQVSWVSNTDISSFLTYYPEGKVEQSRDEVNLNLVSGEHKITLKGLLPDTKYVLVVKGLDRIVNEARSDSQTFTTATDTRAPKISEVLVETYPGEVDNGSGKKNSQIIVSWKTDEPATSKVEYGEGNTDIYEFKTPEDDNLKLNHVVIINNLDISKIYHLRAVSNDKAKNESKSQDVVTITAKTQDNAFDLIFKNIRNIFNF